MPEPGGQPKTTKYPIQDSRINSVEGFNHISNEQMNMRINRSRESLLNLKGHGVPSLNRASTRTIHGFWNPGSKPILKVHHTNRCPFTNYNREDTQVVASPSTLGTMAVWASHRASSQTSLFSTFVIEQGHQPRGPSFVATPIRLTDHLSRTSPPIGGKETSSTKGNQPSTSSAASKLACPLQDQQKKGSQASRNSTSILAGSARTPDRQGVREAVHWRNSVMLCSAFVFVFVFACVFCPR